MVRYAKQWPNRVWAIEGCQGIGRHIATRPLADGKQVVDVPPKLSARARVFATGQGRKTDRSYVFRAGPVRKTRPPCRPLLRRHTTHRPRDSDTSLVASTWAAG